MPNPASSQNFKRRPGSFVLCVGGLFFLDEVLHAASPQLPVFSHRPTSLKSQSDPGPSSHAHCGCHCLLGPAEKVMGMRTTWLQPCSLTGEAEGLVLLCLVIVPVPQ